MDPYGKLAWNLESRRVMLLGLKNTNSKLRKLISKTKPAPSWLRNFSVPLQNDTKKASALASVYICLNAHLVYSNWQDKGSLPEKTILHN